MIRKMKVTLLVLASALCMAKAMTTPEPPTDDAECGEGRCCNAFCARRIDRTIPNPTWDCDLYSIVWDECQARFPECTAEYDYASEPNSCFRGYANQCEDMAQCCWSRFWNETSLTDRKPGEGIVRGRWGDFFCERAKRDATVPGLYWTMEIQGRSQHCGRLLPTWARLEDTTPTPQLCCTPFGGFDPECSGSE